MKTTDSNITCLRPTILNYLYDFIAPFELLEMLALLRNKRMHRACANKPFKETAITAFNRIIEIGITQLPSYPRVKNELIATSGDFTCQIIRYSDSPTVSIEDNHMSVTQQYNSHIIRTLPEFIFRPAQELVLCYYTDQLLPMYEYDPITNSYSDRSDTDAFAILHCDDCKVYVPESFAMQIREQTTYLWAMALMSINKCKSKPRYFMFYYAQFCMLEDLT